MREYTDILFDKETSEIFVGEYNKAMHNDYTVYGNVRDV